MIKAVFCSTLALVAGSAIVCYADAKQDVEAAADKLANGGNYSWKTTVENAGGGGGGGRGGFGGPQEGKTANGVTAITTHNNDMDRTTYRKGDKFVMQNQDGEWMTGEEMAAARGGGNGGNANGGQRRGRGRGAGGPGGAQPLPAEQVKDMVSKTKSLTMADGAYSGELTEEAAKASLMGGGRGRRGGNAGGGGNGPDITDAKATVKVWVKDGVVSKYTSHVSGKVSFNGNDREVDRTTTTEFNDVGSTKVDVPADAAKKLG
jgi:hypothetical protein